MTFHDWKEAGGMFKLHGGPLDGQSISPDAVGASGWPSVLNIHGHVYGMRVGHFERYDFKHSSGYGLSLSDDLAKP